jgi:glutamate 5-kinase
LIGLIKEDLDILEGWVGDARVNREKYSSIIRSAKRIVVKVGTSSLTYPTGKLNLSRLEWLARELSDLNNQGLEVILVSSGAVGAGLGRLGFKRRPVKITEKQAAAAVGQGILMHIYEKLFSEYSQVVAQVLLTRFDLIERRSYLNARNALITLLNFGVIPIVNENDTITVEGLQFGDNDTLSALVAGLVDADLLIVLSDIDGLYTADPREDPQAVLLPVIEEITDDLDQLAGGVGSELASGGMVTKIQAARIATSSGLYMVIANSKEERVIRRILNGESFGTLFVPKEHKLDARQRWIAFGSTVRGSILVDAGASEAVLQRGKSLLPSGISKVEGVFEAGQVVRVISSEGVEIARGIANYSSGAVDRIRGRKTSEIEEILGFKDYDEVIHRNNMILI